MMRFSLHCIVQLFLLFFLFSFFFLFTPRPILLREFFPRLYAFARKIHALFTRRSLSCWASRPHWRSSRSRAISRDASAELSSITQRFPSLLSLSSSPPIVFFRKICQALLATIFLSREWVFSLGQCSPFKNQCPFSFIFPSPLRACYVAYFRFFSFTEPGLYSPTERLNFGILRTLDNPKSMKLVVINSSQKPIHITVSAARQRDDQAC